MPLFRYRAFYAIPRASAVNYLQFLCFFLIAPAALLLAIHGNAALGRTFAIIGTIAGLLLLYTLPWLHLVTNRGILAFDPDKALGTLWLVPFEAYAFVLLQVAFTGALTFVVLRRAWWRD
jgi:lycopene cyclase domain-containing protein